MPDFKNGHYVRTTRSVASHLTQGTLASMVKDIFKYGAKNDIETAIQQQVNSGSLTFNAAAKEIKDDKFLSQGGYAGKTPLTMSSLAVCHKISFASFDIAMVALMNLELNAGVSSTDKIKAWDAFETLLAVLYPHGGIALTTAQQLRAFIANGQTALACDEAHSLLLEFDRSNQNLYFGFQDTNVRVSSNVDMHFDIVAALTSAGPAMTTPRGPLLMTSLNDLQTLLGLKLSSQLIEVEYAGTVKIKWAMSSGLDGGGMIECT